MKTKMTLVHVEDPVTGVIGDMGVRISVQCLSCRHFRTIGISCDAFPEGIPAEIIRGKFDHSRPYPGDNGIVFEKKPVTKRRNT